MVHSLISDSQGCIREPNIHDSMVLNISISGDEISVSFGGNNESASHLLTFYNCRSVTLIQNINITWVTEAFYSKIDYSNIISSLEFLDDLSKTFIDIGINNLKLDIIERSKALDGKVDEIFALDYGEGRVAFIFSGVSIETGGAVSAKAL